jgi:hypothetical protein
MLQPIGFSFNVSLRKSLRISADMKICEKRRGKKRKLFSPDRFGKKFVSQHVSWKMLWVKISLKTGAFESVLISRGILFNEEIFKFNDH